MSKSIDYGIEWFLGDKLVTTKPVFTVQLILTNNLNPGQDRQNVRLDLDPSRLILLIQIVFL